MSFWKIAFSVGCVILLVLGLAFLTCAGCGVSMLGVGALGLLERSGDRAAAIEQIEAYYHTVPVRGGWSLVDIRSKGGKIVVSVSLPLDAARSLLEQEPETQRNRIATDVCPGGEIWEAIGSGDIVIHPSIPGEDIVEEVSCRSWFHLYGF